MISGYHFAFIRFLGAVYLGLIFVASLFGSELFADQLGRSASDDQIHSAYGLIGAVGTSWAIPGIVAAIGLALGRFRQVSALVLLGVWTSTVASYDSTILFQPLVVFLLLCAALPVGEPLAWAARTMAWRVPGWARFLLFGTLLSQLGLSFDLKFDGLTDVLPNGINNAIHSVYTIVLSFIWVGLFWRLRKWLWALLCVGSLLLSLTHSVFVGLECVFLCFATLEQSWLSPRHFTAKHPIIYFDGVCNLCNQTVDFIIAEDVAQRFHFAPIQGDSAQLLTVEAVRNGTTMALQDAERVYTQSEAVLLVAAGLGGIWRILSWSRFVPRWLRDRVYEGVQRNRYRVFGRSDTCRLPTASERERFLD